MREIIHHRSSAIRRTRGVVLLAVLFVIFAITILSLGFLTRCDTELACGQNMLLHTQMEQLADSALEHARGLILQPQDVGTEYWTGATAQHLVVDSSDFYDVNVVRDESNPNERRNYTITCEAYELKNAQKVGSSRLLAQLRLDPCIALWTGADTVLRPRQVLWGDLYCAGSLVNLGAVYGDVFSNALTGTVTGQHKAAADLSLGWPPVTSTYANPNYLAGSIASDTLSATTYTPARVWRHTGDLIINGNVTIQGMLLVNGSLYIRGNTNLLTAAKNLPALYVSGNLVIEDVDSLRIEGLAVVEGSTRISAAATNIRILGGLFVWGTVTRTVPETVTETASDSSTSNCDCIEHDAPTWHPTGGRHQGALEFDGVNDYLYTPDSASSLQLTGNYTLSVWVKAAGSQKPCAAILAKTNAAGSSNHWALQFGGGSPQELRVYHPTDHWGTGITTHDLADPDRWYNITVMRWGFWMSSYLDGALRKLGMWTVGPGSDSGHLNVGVDRTANLAYVFTGQMDDLRIYNQAVGSMPDGLSNLIGHWKFDESGSDVTIIAEPARSAVVAGGYPEQYWNQAAGAFFRSIRRN
jgi:hypothetical protein